MYGLSLYQRLLPTLPLITVGGGLAGYGIGLILKGRLGAATQISSMLQLFFGVMSISVGTVEAVTAMRLGLHPQLFGAGTMMLIGVYLLSIDKSLYVGMMAATFVAVLSITEFLAYRNPIALAFSLLAGSAAFVHWKTIAERARR